MMGKREMDVQEPSDLSVEVHFATLNARAKKRALAHFENLSRQSQAIRVDESSNTDPVTNFHLRHDSLLSDNIVRKATPIIVRKNRRRKEELYIF